MLSKYLQLLFALSFIQYPINASQTPFFTYNTEQENPKDLECFQKVLFLLPYENFSTELNISHFVPENPLPKTKQPVTPIPAIELLLKTQEFQRRKYLGLLHESELTNPYFTNTKCSFAQIQKKIRSKIKKDAKKLRDTKLNEIVTALIENSKKPENTLVITKALEKELVKRCQNLLKQGDHETINNLLNKIEKEIQYQLTSDFCVGKVKESIDPYQEDFWELKLLSRPQKLHEAQNVLSKYGLLIPPYATTFSYNKTKQSVVFGTFYGQLIFINLITRDSISCISKNNQTPIRTVFFDNTGEVIFAYHANGMLTAWDLTNHTNIFHSIIAPDHHIAIPNHNRTKLLLFELENVFQDASQCTSIKGSIKEEKPMVASIKKLSPANALLRKICTGQAPISPTSPLCKRYEKIKQGV